MPAGPIGSVWGTGTWSDTAWEENTWADYVPPPIIPTPAGTMTVGTVINLGQDIVYNLPSVLVEITVYTAAGTIEVSLDRITWQAITLDSNHNFITSALFIRSVDDDSVAIAKSLEGL